MKQWIISVEICGHKHAFGRVQERFVFSPISEQGSVKSALCFDTAAEAMEWYDGTLNLNPWLKDYGDITLVECDPLT